MARYVLLRLISLLWLAGSIVVLLVPPFWSSAIVGASAFIGEFIPGLYLYVRERKESV